MRKQHPYYMYDAIMGQSEAVARVVNQNKIDSVRPKIQGCRRLFIVGTGSSFHAALAGQYLFSHSDSRPVSQAITSFNFALYPPDLSSDDYLIVISHRGTKKYSFDSLRLAQVARAKTLLITGKTDQPEGSIADDIVYTVDQEQSSAHTISYTSAIGVIAALANHSLSISEVTTAMQRCLLLEDSMKGVAKLIKDVPKVWLAGGGPSEVTALEIGLKIKETSYTQAEGMSTEALFHGPFQSAQSEDFFILIAPDGKAQSRTLELIPAIQAIGARYIVIGNKNPDKYENWYEIPELAEEYTTFNCVLPLQLLTYYLALEKDTNPDNFRLEDPRFAAAEKFMKL